MSDVTVVSIIRNGIENGYPFVEAYGSWLPYADRIIVVDGGSRDGTYEVLASLAEVSSKVEVHLRPWPGVDAGGRAIATFTDAAVTIAASGSNWIVYVQADEIYTRAQRERMSTWRNGPLEFSGAVNFWNSTDLVLSNDFPMRYVRAFPGDTAVRAVGDGYTFDTADMHVTTLPERFLHYGWCFPVNILQKHVNHAAIYRDSDDYRLRGRLAELMLERSVFDRRLLHALAPQYDPVPFVGEHPECMRHLVGLEVYDPYIGLDLLRSGTTW